MKEKILLVLSILFLINFISAVQVCETYDDFSSGILNNEKWEIRQDVEGQPFTDEYGITNESEDFVFHIQQNEIGDRRTYLFPKQTFTTGDILEYDFNVLSKEGNSMQMDLLTGNQYIRVGIMGYNNGVQGYDELGKSHIKIIFQENNFHLERTSPSNITLIDNLALTNANGNYELYIGAFSGHNGKIHIDFDNFKICREQTLSDRISILEEWKILIDNWREQLAETLNKIAERLNNHEKRISDLENNENSGECQYINYLPTDARRYMICEYAKKNNLTEYSDLGWNCKITLRLSTPIVKICNCKEIN